MSTPSWRCTKANLDTLVAAQKIMFDLAQGRGEAANELLKEGLQQHRA
ncbi:MAG: hypothetical protein R3C69_01030 [Geminicoccaceae bacterium]